MIEERTWKEFKDFGLLWFINRVLHLFGWSIVYEYQEIEEADKPYIDCYIYRVYPARVGFRGFGEEYESEGFIKLSAYLVENIRKLYEEAKE